MLEKNVKKLEVSHNEDINEAKVKLVQLEKEQYAKINRYENQFVEIKKQLKYYQSKTAELTAKT